MGGRKSNFGLKSSGEGRSAGVSPAHRAGRRPALPTSPRPQVNVPKLTHCPPSVALSPCGNPV